MSLADPGLWLALSCVPGLAQQVMMGTKDSIEVPEQMEAGRLPGGYWHWAEDVARRRGVLIPGGESGRESHRGCVGGLLNGCTILSVGYNRQCVEEEVAGPVDARPEEQLYPGAVGSHGRLLRAEGMRQVSRP